MSLFIIICLTMGSASAIDVNDVSSADEISNEINRDNASYIKVEDTKTDIENINKTESIVVSNNSNTKNVESISVLSVSSVSKNNAISSVSASTIPLSQILTGAEWLKKYVDTKHGLPDKVNVGFYIETEKFLYLMGSAINNIDNSKTSATYTVKSVNSPAKDLNGDWVTSSSISKANYVVLAKRILTYINDYGRAPNYATLSDGKKANYNLYTYAFAGILTYYKNNKALISSYVFRNSIFETYSISNNLSDRAKNDLIFYITTDNIISPSTDLAMLNKIKDVLIALGYNAKVLGVGPNYHNNAYHYGCTGSNSVLLCCFGAVDACCIEEWVGKTPELGTWFPTSFKGANVLSVFYLDPYGAAANINDYVGVAWDAKTGKYYGEPLENPAQYMKDNGISYIQTGTVDSVIKILKLVFTGSTKTVIGNGLTQTLATTSTC